MSDMEVREELTKKSGFSFNMLSEERWDKNLVILFHNNVLMMYLD